MRTITTVTRLKVEAIISRILDGKEVTLQERIELHKYSNKIPFIRVKLKQALNQRNFLTGKDYLD